MDIEYLKSLGYKFNITTHGYSVEYNGQTVAWDRPLFRKRYGSRIDLKTNLDKAFQDAEKFFYRNSALNHIEKHGNLVLWGNNLCVIMDMYEELKTNNLIIDAGKHWEVVVIK